MKIKQANLFQLLSIKFVSFIFLSFFVNVQAEQFLKESQASLDTSYLKSKDVLKDYILDSGDILNIEFENIPDFSGLYAVNEQGEIYLKRLKYTYVRGLTISEVKKLLEKIYEEFLLSPKISIRIGSFRPITVSVSGEVRSPRIIKFPALVSNEIFFNLENKNTSNLDIYTSKITKKSNQSGANNLIKTDNKYITTLSNAIKEAGGLTSYSDISKIEVVRDIPLEKGGGKKKAIIDFTYYVKNGNSTNDIRLYDGDYILIPALQKKDPSIIPNSVLADLSPKFIDVTISGKIETPGTFLIPLEGSLSDIMNLSGPRKPLSGKIYLIRYKRDGSLLRENIKYSAKAIPGSKNNPFLVQGDLINVKNSTLGRASGTIKTITEPFINIYATKELINNF